MQEDMSNSTHQKYEQIEGDRDLAIEETRFVFHCQFHFDGDIPKTLVSNKLTLLGNIITK